MNLEEMKDKDLFDLAETEEGREFLIEALKRKLEENPDITAKIGNFVLQLFAFGEKLGEKIINNQEDILAFLTACQKLSEMPEEEARAIVEAALREDPEYDPEEAEGIIQQINFKKPESLLIATPKVIRKLYDGETDFTDGIQPVDISPRKQKGKYVVPVELVFVSTVTEEGLQIQKHLTPFDKQVQTGIFTLLENGYTAFTAKQVYEVFAGKTTTSPQAIGHVTRSINKQRTTLISIDWTAHAKMKGLPVDQQQGDYIATEENLLLLRRVKLRCNGQELDGYSVIEEPILYRYAKQVGQLSTLDRKLLDVPVNNTEVNIVLRNELLERIDTMKKRKGKISNNISFETLYKLAGIGENRKERERIRTAVEKMLNAWKKEGFISGYAMNQEKRKIVSVSVQI